MSDLLIKLLRIRLPVPKRMFDFGEISVALGLFLRISTLFIRLVPNLRCLASWSG